MDFILYHCSDCANKISELIEIETERKLLYDILESNDITNNFKDYMYAILHPKFKYTRYDEIRKCIEIFDEHFSKDINGKYIGKNNVTQTINDLNGIISSAGNIFQSFIDISNNNQRS